VFCRSLFTFSYRPSQSYGSWIYNYLCNQYLSPLKVWIRTPFMAWCTQYNIMWSSLSVTWHRSGVFSGIQLYILLSQACERTTRYNRRENKIQMKLWSYYISNISVLTIKLKQLVLNVTFNNISVISWRSAYTHFLIDRRNRMVVGFTTTCALSTYHH
jgi:hypothetical protein